MTNSLDETQRAARDQFESRSTSYGKSHILADVADVGAALDALTFPKAGRGLDVATGGGHTAAYLSGRGLEVTASDIAPSMVDNAVKLAAERGFTITGAVHTAEILPYEDSSFCVVSCRVAAHHFSSPPAFVKEVSRVLEPGGWFLLIDGSIPDDEPEARQWIHDVEKLRDPSHGAFLTPGDWRQLIEASGMEVIRCETTPFKQPDLEWYFETAATSPENREAVRELIEKAPDSALQVFQIEREGERIVWWWPRLTLLAKKPGNLNLP